MTQDQMFSPLFEYVVGMDNGTEFFTGGFESIDSLRKCLETDTIDGCWFRDPDMPWQQSYLNPAHIAAITDLRTGTE